MASTQTAGLRPATLPERRRRPLAALSQRIALTVEAWKRFRSSKFIKYWRIQTCRYDHCREKVEEEMAYYRDEPLRPARRPLSIVWKKVREELWTFRIAAWKPVVLTVIRGVWKGDEVSGDWETTIQREYRYANRFTAWLDGWDGLKQDPVGGHWYSEPVTRCYERRPPLIVRLAGRERIQRWYEKEFAIWHEMEEAVRREWPDDDEEIVYCLDEDEDEYGDPENSGRWEGRRAVDPDYDAGDGIGSDFDIDEPAGSGPVAAPPAEPSGPAAKTA